MKPTIFGDLSTRRFWRKLSGHWFAGFGAAALGLELLQLSFKAGPSFRGWPLLLSICVGSLIYAIVRSWPRPIEESYSAPATRISIVKGDLLTHDCHLVIGVCDTFDTATPDVIARSSLQGQMLERLYRSDRNELDRQLDDALCMANIVGSIKKLGKTTKYELGTVATLRERGRRLFLLAYSEMDIRNEAHATIDGLWRSLASLWREVSAQSNGEPVAAPVIGGGQSRLSPVLPLQDSIRFMILSFILASRSSRVCEELRIVVRDMDFEKLGRLELQAFLTSLRPS